VRRWGERKARVKAKKRGERNGVEGSVNYSGSCACAAAGKDAKEMTDVGEHIIPVWRCVFCV